MLIYPWRMQPQGSGKDLFNVTFDYYGRLLRHLGNKLLLFVMIKNDGNVYFSSKTIAKTLVGSQLRSKYTYT